MADDLTKKAADFAGKKDGHYRVDEFENRDGQDAAALVDNETGSITIQSNSGREGLEKAVDEGNLVYLDPGVPPKADTVTVPESKTTGNADKDNKVNAERVAATRTNAVREAEASRVTDGYSILGEDESKAPAAQLKSPK